MSQDEIIKSLSKQELEDILCELSNSNWKVNVYLYKSNRSYTEMYRSTSIPIHIRHLLNKMIMEKSIPILRDKKIELITNKNI